MMKVCICRTSSLSLRQNRIDMKRLTFAIVVLAWILDLTLGTNALAEHGQSLLAVLNIAVDVVFIPYLIDFFYRVK